ncbi:dihydrofolate reductase [Helicoverpa zea nudivirus 2]|uniref:dihydrofolate reductase n=1 Tax=Helicoverpa zea nudivirus 2 TaxID=1128424 RepID=G9I0D7_HZNV2|nr:orf111 gene product [Helicoverpa zea nudivirus 2]AEW69660.1 dihydrofolate reductase [Helicoverpa zea nudivirus 2]
MSNFVLFKLFKGSPLKLNKPKMLTINITYPPRPKIPINLIVAVCENNMGIGMNNSLPWHLKREMAHFTKTTTTATHPNKNAVIMGRLTWESIPKRFRPLPGRVNIVLTTKHRGDYDGATRVSNFDEAIRVVESRGDIETAWVIGGASVYAAAMTHPNCHQIHLTAIKKYYECNVFFPKIDTTRFELISETPCTREGDVQYSYKVYQQRNTHASI